MKNVGIVELQQYLSSYLTSFAPFYHDHDEHNLKSFKAHIKASVRCKFLKNILYNRRLNILLLINSIYFSQHMVADDEVNSS